MDDFDTDDLQLRITYKLWDSVEWLQLADLPIQYIDIIQTAEKDCDKGTQAGDSAYGCCDRVGGLAHAGIHIIREGPPDDTSQDQRCDFR